jgi:hypothetical protein
MKTTRRIANAAMVSASIAATLIVAGCSSTHQTRGGAQASPFLGNPAQLREGTGSEAKLVYVNPKADFRKYTKIQFEPVVLVASNAKSSTFSAMSKEDQQAVVNYVDAKIREELGRDYRFVTSPGADVMRLRVAITEAKGSTVVLDTLSSVMPPAVALSVLKTVATGTGTAVGKAGVEMELLDSSTGERLAAGVDERAGRKYTFRFDKFSRYHAVESAFDYWASRLQERLAAMRADKTGK